MSTSDRLAAVVSPMFLRAALAATFLWAGTGKLFYTMPVQGDAAARLANMGLSLTPSRGQAAGPGPAAAPMAAPAQPLPPPDAKPEGAKDKDGKKAGGGRADSPVEMPGSRVAMGTTGWEDAWLMAQTTLAVAQAGAPTTAATAVSGTRAYTAEDFPLPISVRRVYALSLMIQSAGETKGSMPLWPPRLAQGNWPLTLAWAVGLTELVGGGLMALGLFARSAGLGLAGVMGGALWLTEIGPAVQGGKAVLGFLPPYAFTSIEQWMSPLWQFGLMMMALAVVFGGAGGLSVDRTVLGRSGGSGGGGGGGEAKR